MWFPLRSLGPILLAGLALLSCGGPPRGVVRLWEGEKQPVRTAEGWVRGVVVEGTRTETLSNVAGESWRAVAYPLDGAGLMALDAGRGPEEYQLNGPTALKIDFHQPGATLSITTGGRVLLAAPRLSPDRHRGRRCLFILADALRADHADAAHMPETAGYFRDGLHFSRAYSPESWTLPSMASLFTGKVPAALRHPDGTLISLPSGETTLAKRLAAQGWIGAAVVSNYTLNHENGFSQGFDWFTAPAVVEAGQAPGASWVNGRASQLQDWLPDEDLFLYLHYMDLHEPYLDHERGVAVNLPAPAAPATVEEASAIRTAYASSVRHLDQEVRALLVRLPAPEWVVLTADHGELLGEHGLWGHGPTLYNEGIHVPLLITAGSWGSGRVEHAVSTRRLAALLAGEDRKLLEPERAVTAETFAHGPPRFAAFLGDLKVLLFACDLEPAPTADPWQSWLEAHHPVLRFTDADEEGPVDVEARAVDGTLRALIGQFQGFRRGIHLLFRGGGPFRVRIRGAGTGGWAWGNGEELKTERESDGALRIGLKGGGPFCLVSLPAAGGEWPRVEILEGPEPPAPREGPPAAFDAEGVLVWTDRGRPRAEIAGVEETLRRLRSLGYIR